MPSLETTLRNATGDALDAATFSQPLHVVRAYDVTLAAEVAPADATAYVYPGPRRADLLDQVVGEVACGVFVNLMKRLSVDERDTEIDGLITLSNEIEAFLAGLTPGGTVFQRFESGQIGRAPYSLESLRDHNTFDATLLPVYTHFE